MAKTFSRSDRIAEQMQRELADLLMFEVKDPRIGMVTITEVQVLGDLSHAKVFYTTKKNSKAVENGLGQSAGFLRTQLGKRMLLRTVPQLHFIYDTSLDIGMKMDALILQARATDTPT